MLLIVLAAVLVRVALLQTVQRDTLRSAASEQWTRERTLPAQRGTIFDRNGDELALSIPASTVAVNPRQVEDPAGTAELFAQTLGLGARRQLELEAAMAARDRGFVYVARQVDDEKAAQLAALRLAGVTIYREDRRVLPGGTTGRSVIGRTDIDGVGTAGLERQYDHVLRGEPGESSIEVAPGGHSIAGTEQVTSAPVPGNDIILTIDRSVQHAVEQALLERVAQTGARGGQAVVMASQTGDVLAMASIRINDDGVYEVTTGNYAAVDAYEPGSVGKVITVAGALNEGTVTPETTFLVPWRKQYTQGGDYLSDAAPHDEQWMSVEDILVKSSNIGTITISETMGFAKQYDYLRAFGFGERTALDFPDESSGILHPWQEWEGTEKFTVAYGQNVASSPIQLAAAVNTIANDGRYVEPRLVSGIVDGDGEVTELPPSATREVVRPEIAEQMQAMMKQVVCRGTAKQAQVPGLSIAGKTGTGFIAQPGRRLRQGRRDQGLLRQLRRVPAGRGSAGHDPDLDRRPALRCDGPLRRHGLGAGVPRTGADDGPRAGHPPTGRLDGLSGVIPTMGRDLIDLGSLADVVAGPLGGRIVGDPSVVVSGMTHDSRLVVARDAVRVRARP